MKNVMKKILTLVLLSLFVILMALPLCNAVVTPVEVERVKDVGFIRTKGDHTTESFLFHYVNLAPYTQEVHIFSTTYPPDGIPTLGIVKSFVVASGESLDYAVSVPSLSGYGWYMDFRVDAKPWMTPEPWIRLVDDTVVIPPKS